MNFHGHDVEMERENWKQSPAPVPDPDPEEEEEEIDSDPDPEEEEEEEHSFDGLETPPPFLISDSEPSESSEEEDSDSFSDELATPSASDRSTRGKTVSTKGRSSLRPRRSEAPLDPAPEEASPSDLRVKRRLDPEAADGLPGSRLKRQVLVSPSPPPMPPPPPRKISQGEQTHWRCTLDEHRCSHVVPNAKTRDGRHAIERHYESHGQVMQDARQIIEMEAGRYQVDHLMEKIKMMSRKWEESKPSPLKGLGE
jgi:hypothetical protein